LADVPLALIIISIYKKGMKTSDTQYVYVSLDSYECNGCGTCAELCPAVFRMDDTGDKAELIDGCVPLIPELEQAATMCPVKCIELEAC